MTNNCVKEGSRSYVSKNDKIKQKYMISQTKMRYNCWNTQNSEC